MADRTKVFTSAKTGRKMIFLPHHGKYWFGTKKDKIKTLKRYKHNEVEKEAVLVSLDYRAGNRKLARSVAHKKMELAGIRNINKARRSKNGGKTIPSYFADNWKEALTW